MSSDYDQSPGPDAPVNVPEGLSDDERAEMDRLSNKADSGLLQQNERDHLDYLRRRDAQEQQVKTARENPEATKHPVLDAIPKTPEEMQKLAAPDPVALNRLQSSAVQAAMAGGAVQPHEVEAWKQGLAAQQQAPSSGADVESHRAANRTTGLDENDRIEKDENGVERVKPIDQPAPNDAPGGGMQSGSFEGDQNDGTGPGNSTQPDYAGPSDVQPWPGRHG